MSSSRSSLSKIERERLYGIAGRAAGEAALEHGRDGARLRSATDAYLLSRIARAVVDAIHPPEGFKVPTCGCGHALGDHTTVRVPSTHVAPGGACHRCDCQEFRER